MCLPKQLHVFPLLHVVSDTKNQVLSWFQRKADKVGQMVTDSHLFRLEMFLPI